MSATGTAPPDGRGDGAWAPPLAGLRLLAEARSTALLSPDASVQWWCAPDFDDEQAYSHSPQLWLNRHRGVLAASATVAAAAAAAVRAARSRETERMSR